MLCCVFSSPPVRPGGESSRVGYENTVKLPGFIPQYKPLSIWAQHKQRPHLSLLSLSKPPSLHLQPEQVSIPVTLSRSVGRRLTEPEIQATLSYGQVQPLQCRSENRQDFPLLSTETYWQSDKLISMKRHTLYKQIWLLHSTFCYFSS